MKRLHLFFPENDLALAKNMPNYTAPAAAVRLRKSGATLPMWYGEPGDMFICEGVNGPWLKQMLTDFGMDILPYNYNPDGLSAAPWGWSIASREIFEDFGFPKSELPSNELLDSYRQLSHRRTAAAVGADLEAAMPFRIAPPAIECTTYQEVLDYATMHPEGIVIKLPWSSSGRGLLATDAPVIPSQKPNIDGMFARNGSVMVEPRYNKRQDFAMLFTMEGGKCRYDGLSVFSTVQFGTYCGNDLAPQQELEERLTQLIPREQFDAVRTALPALLEKHCGIYSGPLGVDMLLTEDGLWAPVLEINFRMTMGHLCHRAYEKYLAPDFHGTFQIMPTASMGTLEPPVIENHRLVGGAINLAQPASEFAFIIAQNSKNS